MAQMIERFKPSPNARRLWLPTVIALSLGIIAAAERDIQRRPAEDVRGHKLLWRVVSLNAIGSLTYFRWGRRAGRA